MYKRQGCDFVSAFDNRSGDAPKEESAPLVTFAFAMMTATSAEATAAREERDEAESEENANPEEQVAFLAKWNEGKTRAAVCRCSHICLTSTHNISRALLCAIAKAAVYQSAGKIFGDPKAAVAPLSADLVAYLEGDKGGGATGDLSDLSDLQRDVQELSLIHI